MASTRAIERPALLRSIAVSAVLGVLAIGWGLATGSQMILLDGIYGVIGILLSWLLLHASALANEGPSSSYPFGREAFTPFVIGIQGFVLLAMRLRPGMGWLRSLPLLNWSVSAVNARAVTIYLWHNLMIAASFPVGDAFLHPVGVLYVIAIMVNSMVWALTGRGAWKGRTIARPDSA